MSIQQEKTQWGAVFSLAFSIMMLLITELLPVSLLTPMATELNISQGLAGQTMTATAFVAIFSSLLVTKLTQGVDRKKIILIFTATLVISNAIVAIASNFYILIFGRLLLGAGLGGFWALAPSVTMRLAPEKEIPKALSTVFGGVSVALVIAAPVGSYFGDIVGWRGVFWGATALGLIGFIWQLYILPTMTSNKYIKLSDLWRVAMRPGMRPAMLALLVIFGGQFTFFSYMRPFYEDWVGLSLEAMSSVFLIFGIANVVGTSLSAKLISFGLKKILMIMPLCIGVIGLLLSSLDLNLSTAAILTASWGFFFGCVPVAWSTWVTRNQADEVENAGGLQVATIQIANTLGAALGGYILNIATPVAPVLCAGILMIIGAIIVIFKVKTREEKA